MSFPQQQIGFKQSRKLCLNVCYLRWLKPNLSPVTSFIPTGLWQLKVLSGVGRMNWKMLFLKKSETFRTSYTFKLFHSITVDRKNEFLNMFDIEPRNVADIISCSVCPSGGDFIKEIKWCLLHIVLETKPKCIWT